MTTKFRIGYPYASSDPQRVREAVVFLRPSSYPGFSSVSHKGFHYQLANTVSGPSILNGIKTGVTGELVESEDPSRRSIAQRGKIIAQGNSMELALVLSVFAGYPDEKNLSEAPLLLFSGSIEVPHGAPPFLDGKIKTYCTKEEAPDCLFQKYKAALMAGAYGLVLPERDARILSEIAEIPWHGVNKISALSQTLPTSPLIFGAGEGELSLIAREIGVSPYYYKRKEEEPGLAALFKKNKRAFSLAFILLLVLLWSLQFFLLPFKGAGVSSLKSPLPKAPHKTFVLVKDLSLPRKIFTATLLPSGLVMVAGGVDKQGRPLRSIEIYSLDQSGGTSSLSVPRSNHTATLLPDGKVLLIGGSIAPPNITTATAELHGPDEVGSGIVTSLDQRRTNHGAILLSSGQVLIAGGWGHVKKRIRGKFVDGDFLKSAELYDPEGKVFCSTGSMSKARYLFGALLLQSGTVLIIGGWNGDPDIYSTFKQAELYDPKTGEFALTSPMKEPRHSPCVTALPGGKVLISGGIEIRKNLFLDTAEIYDPKSGTFTLTGPMKESRSDHTTTLLPSGKVLIIGGRNKKGDLNSAELYDPKKGQFTLLPERLNRPRWGHQAVLVPSGEVLLLGGQFESTCEVYRGPYLSDERHSPFIAFMEKFYLPPAHFPFGKKIRIKGENLLGKKETLVILIQTGGSGSWSGPSRYFRLTPSEVQEKSLEVTLPPKNFNPPGYYLFFVMVDGVLSKGWMVRLGN